MKQSLRGRRGSRCPPASSRLPRLPRGPGAAPGALRLLALAALIAVPSAGLRAQIGPWVVNRPWAEEPHWADTFDDIVYFGLADTQVDGENARVFYWNSFGRIKFEKESRDPIFSLGYKAPTLSASASDGVVDGEYNDVALVGVGRLGELLPGWKLHLVGGLGTANDGHWNNTDAIYGAATLNAATELSEVGGLSTLHLGITYDGNGNLLPDIPLPYANWQWRPCEGLDLWLGTHDSRVVWDPAPGLKVTGKYGYPVDAEVDVEYEILEGFWVFGQYSRALHGFWIEDEDDRRYFYQHDRVGGGLRWITWLFDVSVGGGYALDQKFRTGFDMRELHDLADLDGGWYVCFRAQGVFSFP